MKKVTVAIMLSAFVFGMSFTSCKKKEECHECHYDDANGDQIDLGEKCGEELESLEANGYDDNGNNREVHCHEH